MVVKQARNNDELQTIFRDAESRLVVIDFYADWCPPCRMIAPYVENLSNLYPNVVFVKFNVDQCRFTCQTYNINAMPTFVFFIQSREVDRIQGANKERLQQLVDLHSKETNKVVVPKTSPHERQWLHKNVVSRVDHVMQYEDEVNQMLALSLIPVDEINQKSMIDGKVSTFAQATHLMDWFYSFFKWVNNPNCHTCKSAKTQFITKTECAPDEQAKGGGQVEVYKCEDCEAKTRFVRYNNLMTLLETREGRCGEWADCFTLCCRAIGIEARYVICTEDHVWTEIYDPDRAEWIHCDPCENVIDRPLLYEKGWKKEIRYVFGIAHDHVQDVTWRYVANQKACRQRRTYCREPIILNCMTKLNLRLANKLSEERKKELKNRQVSELISFLVPNNNVHGDDELQGRVSGSIQWRVTRGEAEVSRKHNPTVVTPTETEIAARLMILEYDCVNNVYRRPNDNNAEIKDFWSLINQAENPKRKVERDWGTVYICRTEGSKTANFSWKFSFDGHKVKRAHISLGKFSNFLSGRGTATICAGDMCMMVEETGEAELNKLSNVDYLELSINLEGGDGDAAWQHAQLFRTLLAEPHVNMRVEIEFE